MRQPQPCTVQFTTDESTLTCDRTDWHVVHHDPATGQKFARVPRGAWLWPLDDDAQAERDVANAVNRVPNDPAMWADTIAELEAEFPDGGGRDES